MKAWLVTAVIVGLVAFVAVPFAIDAVSLTCFGDPVEAHLAIDTAEVRSRQVEVAGTTDLPDGAVIRYFFLHESELGDVTRLPRFQAGGETIAGAGQFRFKQLLVGWPEGEAVIDVWFEVGPEAPQPADVVEAFGANGQCLEGPEVGADSPGDRQTLNTDASVRLPHAEGP